MNDKPAHEANDTLEEFIIRRQRLRIKRLQNKVKSPSKKALLQKLRQAEWANLVLSRQAGPWLQMPGMIIFLDTEDAEDLDVRFDVLELAKRTLLKHVKGEK